MWYGWRLVSVVLLSLLVPVRAWTLDIYTEHYPPMNYLAEDGQPAGLVYEVMVDLLRDMQREDLITRIQFVPWTRAYHEAKFRPDTLLFSVIRTAAREPDFIWVGPVAVSGNDLIATEALYEQLGENVTAETLVNYTIGVIREDYGEFAVANHPVLKRAVTKPVGDPRQAMRMLQSGRIDLWSYSFATAQAVLKIEGRDPGELRTVMPLGQSELLYLGFNPQTDPEIIFQFQRALETIKAIDPITGYSRLQQLEEKYSAPSLEATLASLAAAPRKSDGERLELHPKRPHQR